MKLRIKIVPDDQPNADGRWISVRLTRFADWWPQSRVDWSRLDAAAPAGHHAVAYNLPHRRKHK